MQISRRSFGALAPFFAGLCLLLLLLINAEAATVGVRRGVSLCLETLLPSLFPFLVVSEWLVRSNVGEWLGRYPGRPLCRLLGLSERGAAALLLGLLCGFPVGTVAAVSYCKRGEMSEAELRRLVLFINNPGTGFLIGAVGRSLFGNEAAGVVLFLSVWLSSLLIGIFLRILCGPVPQIPEKPSNGMKKASFFTDLTESVSGALPTLLQIFSFVIFFSSLSASMAALPLIAGLPARGLVLLTGLPEMTSGISAAVTLLPPEEAFRAAALFAGTAGLSICMQLYAIAGAYAPRLSAYLLAKGVQGCLTLLLASLYLWLLRPPLVTAQSMATFAQNTLQQLLTAAVPLTLLLLGFLVIFARRKAKK